MNVIYLGGPHTGGTWTVFLNLHKALKAQGINLTWRKVYSSAEAKHLRSEWPDAFSLGRTIEVDDGDITRQGKALLEHLERAAPDVVVLNVLTDPVSMNAARYLKKNINRLMIVHNITPATYQAARLLRDYVQLAVGVSPRISNDLISKKGFHAEATTWIPNAIECANYSGRVRRYDSIGPLRIAYLGRIKDQDKGVLWIGDLLSLLSDLNIEVSIAGDGPDKQELEHRLRRNRHRVRFLGRLSPNEVPEFLREQDILFQPSRFEGLGITLVEALAAGCVPVVSKIRGVTDFVVDQGRTGCVFPIGDVKAAANEIRRLYRNPAELELLSANASTDAHERFDVNAMGRQYASSLHKLSESSTARAPLDPSQWSYPTTISDIVRSKIPVSIKNQIRRLLEASRRA